MISIFFPAGAYGSTLEYCIRRFSKEFTTINAEILETGSMHGFAKNCHIYEPSQYNLLTNAVDIVTPVYPMANQIESMADTVSKFKEIDLIDHSSVIFITLPTLSSILRTKLNTYYKLPKHPVLLSGVHSNIKQWNPEYKSIDDLQVWEKREAISLIDNNTEFMNVHTLAHPNWLTISSDDVLYNLPSMVSTIIHHLGLTFDDTGIDEFNRNWFNAQQYIIDKLQLIEMIVDSTINYQFFKWKEVELITEALVQHKLRLHGYELQCYNLNQFPTDSTTLRKLLIR